MEETTDILKEIGQRVKDVRRYLNLKQNNFAQALDISNANLCEIEAGAAKPRFEFLYNISLKFNVNLLYLLHGQGEMFIKGPGEGRTEEKKDEFDEAIELLKKLPTYRKELTDLLRDFNDSHLLRYTVISYYRTYKIQNWELIKKDIELSKGGSNES